MTIIESIKNGVLSAKPWREPWILALIGAVIFLVLLALYFIFLRGSYVPLFTKLRPSDAAVITADLDKRKVPFRLEAQGCTILVPKDVVDKTRIALSANELPTKGAVGFEIFNKSDMGSTEFEQKINYQRALQGELERTIMSLVSIESVRVHLSIPESSVFQEEKRPPKASVTLVARDGAVISPGTVEGIRQLVAAAVPDLEAQNVVVLDERGDVLVALAATQAPEASPGVAQTHAVEDYYAARIRAAIEPVAEGALVQVSIDQEAGAKIGDWVPDHREFPLSVVISVPTPPTPLQAQTLRDLVSKALYAGAGIADVVTFAQMVPRGATVATSPAFPSRIRSQARGDVPAMLPSVDRFWATVVAWLLAPLLFLAGYLSRGRLVRSPQAMSARRRALYVDELKDALNQVDGHAASSR